MDNSQALLTNRKKYIDVPHSSYMNQGFVKKHTHTHTHNFNYLPKQIIEC